MQERRRIDRLASLGAEMVNNCQMTLQHFPAVAAVIEVRPDARGKWIAVLQMAAQCRLVE